MMIHMKIGLQGLLISFLLLACNGDLKGSSEENGTIIKEPTVNDLMDLYGKADYLSLYNLFNDSLNCHERGKLNNVPPTSSIILDSIFLMNTKKDFVIASGMTLSHGNGVDAHYTVFFRKFHDKWYLNLRKSRSISETNLSYLQVHRLIIKLLPKIVYRNFKKKAIYLDESVFDKNGYGDKGLIKTLHRFDYPDSEYEMNFQQYFVETSIRDYYYGKSWHSIYLPYNYSFSYSRKRKELTVTAQIPYWNEFPLSHKCVWIGTKVPKFLKYNRETIIKPGVKNKTITLSGIDANSDVDILFSLLNSTQIKGTGNIVHRFKVINGRVRFEKLVPYEPDLLDYCKTNSLNQDSVRLSRQKIIDQTFGEFYGKNAAVRSVVVD